VPDDENRLGLVFGEAGHDGVVVGKAAVAVDFREAREQALDVVLERGTIGMPCDEHPLPRRQRTVQLRPHGLNAPAQLLDLPVAGVGVRQQFERLDLLEEDGNRLFEFEQGLGRHQLRPARRRRFINAAPRCRRRPAVRLRR
jgi:hypothetical protein